jgi:DNA-binding transcriptional regulator YiaG
MDGHTVDVMDALSDALERARDRRRLPPPAERRARREGAGLSQADIARAVGVTPAAVSRWEAGTRRVPRGAVLRTYLEVLERLG